MTKLEKILRNPPKKRIPERLSAYEIEYPYRQMLSFSSYPDAKMTVIGSLGEAGYFDLNQIRSISEKTKFLRILHRCAKHLKQDR